MSEVPRTRFPYMHLEATEPQWHQSRAAAYRDLRGYFVPNAGGRAFQWLAPSHRSAAVMALVGFTILADWLGSDSREAYFPALVHDPSDLDRERYASRSL